MVKPDMKFLYDENLNDEVIKEIFMRRFPEYSLRKHFGKPKLKKNVFHQAYVDIGPDPDSFKDGRFEYMNVFVWPHSPALISLLMGYIVYYIIQGIGQEKFMNDVKDVVEEELCKRFHRVEQ